MAPVRTFLPSTFAAPLLVVALTLGTACSDSEPQAAPATSASTSPTLSPSPTTVDPLPPVPPADVFEGIGGYRFLPASPRLRERTERRFNALLGTKLHAAALKRAKPDEPKRRRERGPVPPELVVLVLSFDLQPEETVEGFHSEVTDTLAEAIGVTEVRLGGRPAYLTKDATPRHQSRVFFFFEETVVVQVFGRLGAAKDLAAKLNGSR